MSDISLKSLLISISSISLIAAPVQAQLIPDNTLGRESSTVVPVSNTRDNIEGGASRGSNLFHSFQEFNVNPGREVYFNNPPGVRNIINRVTGSNISNIFGTLGVNGNANLYLINPNGIFFGEGARLDIRGTFVGTTADGIFLGNDAVYSAKNPENSSLLTVEPGAMFVNQIRNATSSIVNQGNLEITPGGNITLSGDRIENNGAIIAPGGNVFLEAVNGDINVRNIDTTDGVNGGGDINISASGGINVNGTINVSGGDIEVDRFGLPLLSSDNITAKSGSISLLAEGNITLNHSNLFANGFEGGKLEVKSQKKLLSSNVLITSISLGNIKKKAKNIELNGQFIELNNSIFDTVTTGGIEAGDLDINSDILRLVNGSIIGSLTIETATGNTGNLTIKAKAIELIGINLSGGFPTSGLFLQTFSKGNASSLTIETDLLSLDNGAQISTASFGDGNGGNLNISAKTIELLNTDLLDTLTSGLSASAEAKGDAGDLKIATDLLRLEAGTQISTATAALEGGNAGNLTVTAREIQLIGVNSVDSLPSGLFAETRGQGNGGNLLVNTDFLSLEAGAQISVSTSERGKGGNLTITAREIELIGRNPFNGSASGLLSSAIDRFSDGSSTGNGGDININTGLLKIKDGATINSSNFPSRNLFPPGLGSTGNIEIVASEIILDRGTITASGNIQGGGDVSIDSDRFLLLKNRSRITTDVGETKGFPGGNLTINTPIIIATPTDNLFSARAITSQGGNININTLAIFGYPQFLAIDASSSLGIDGNINIVGLTNEINPSTIEAQQTTLSQETPPELDDCPLDLQTTSSSQENPIPATIGFCRTKKGTIMAY